MGVSMSTFFSWPSLSFFTLTLQAGSASMAPKARARVMARGEVPSSNLGISMLRSFLYDSGLWDSPLCDGRRTLNAGAALGNVGNADGQVAVNGNFAEQRFDHAEF